MLLSPRRTSTFGDLLRLVAVWIAVALLLQGFAAVHAHAAGPAHQHRGASLGGNSGGLFAHRQHHDESQRHHHAAADDTVVTLASAAAAAAEEGLDAAAAALIAAFTLLAMTQAFRPSSAGAPVWRAALAWFHRSTTVEPLLKPPRTA